MRDQAYDICRKFLSGEWNKISSNDMVFKTVSGGLSNYLYYCSLPATHTPLNGEPSQVLLRMYGQLLDGNDTKGQNCTEYFPAEDSRNTFPPIDSICNGCVLLRAMFADKPCPPDNWCPKNLSFVCSFAANH
ncbi:unnamed protein product [Oppiella nova]|uniref:Choline/ethanolamine kinase n=1 Tax=Oppiella nova TaxID=334625 RepID=A0A7R9M226_9ACAR|nr:unnamed protein product [Oppiella nova]CAG2169317.1 unnamed protein product [Oppiella nova]